MRVEYRSLIFFTLGLVSTFSWGVQNEEEPGPSVLSSFEIPKEMQERVNQLSLPTEGYSLPKDQMDASDTNDYRDSVELIQKTLGEQKERLVQNGNLQSMLDRTMNHSDWQDQQNRFKNQILELKEEEIGMSKDSVLTGSNQRELTGKSLESDARPLLFVSASIPITALRNYARDLEKINGVMVLQGLVSSTRYLKPTAEFTKKIITKKVNCTGVGCDHYNTEVLIDPVLFNEFEIAEVPALAVDPEFVYTTYCERDGQRNPKAVIYGDLALEALLREHQRLVPMKEIKEWIKTLQT